MARRQTPAKVATIMSHHDDDHDDDDDNDNDDDDIDALQLAPIPGDDEPVMISHALPSPPISPPIIVSSLSSPSTTSSAASSFSHLTAKNNANESKGAVVAASVPIASSHAAVPVVAATSSSLPSLDASLMASSMAPPFAAADLIGTRAMHYQFVSQLSCDHGDVDNDIGPTALYHVRLLRSPASSSSSSSSSATATAATPALPPADLAMKILRCSGESSHDDVWTAFDAERSLTASQGGIIPSHANLCGIYHHFFDHIIPSQMMQWPGEDDDKVLCIVLPLVNQSLHDALQVRRASVVQQITPNATSDSLPLLRLRELLVTTAGLSRALHHLYTHRVVHRHISSHSIWLATGDASISRASLATDITMGTTQAVLADFDNAIHWTQFEATWMLSTTIDTADDIEASFGIHVPPEVAESIAHQVTGLLSLEKADVWQLGRVMVEMMAHDSEPLLASCRYIPPQLDHRHADGDDMIRLKQAVLASRQAMDNLTKLPARLSATYPLQLRTLVSDMLHPEPLRRPSIQQVHDQVHAILVAHMRLELGAATQWLVQRDQKLTTIQSLLSQQQALLEHQQTQLSTAISERDRALARHRTDATAFESQLVELDRVHKQRIADIERVHQHKLAEHERQATHRLADHERGVTMKIELAVAEARTRVATSANEQRARDRANDELRYNQMREEYEQKLVASVQERADSQRGVLAELYEVRQELGRQIMVGTERERDHEHQVVHYREKLAAAAKDATIAAALTEASAASRSRTPSILIDDTNSSVSSPSSSPTPSSSSSLSTSLQSSSSFGSSSPPVLSPIQPNDGKQTSLLPSTIVKPVAKQANVPAKSPSNTSGAPRVVESKAPSKTVSPSAAKKKVAVIAPPTAPPSMIPSVPTIVPRAAITSTAPRWKLFSDAGTHTFVMPDGATRYRILAIGGGGCGVAGFGGGSGYVKTIELLASAIVTIPPTSKGVEVRVGRCGFPGEASSFGTYIAAPGGRPGAHGKGGDGGSGGGAPSCRGGMNGGQGDSEFFGPSGGRGQSGGWPIFSQLFRESKIIAGRAGSGISEWGGGGGGVMINGLPASTSGTDHEPNAGQGFGAAGVLDARDGCVYIEWSFGSARTTSASGSGSNSGGGAHAKVAARTSPSSSPPSSSTSPLAAAAAASASSASVPLSTTVVALV